MSGSVVEYDAGRGWERYGWYAGAAKARRVASMLQGYGYTVRIVRGAKG